MWYQRKGDLIKLITYVQPGAKMTQIVGTYQDALKISIQAPPIDGLANKRVQAFLANLFEVPRRQVKLVHGLKGRRKIFEVTGSKVDLTCLIETKGGSKTQMMKMKNALTGG